MFCFFCILFFLLSTPQVQSIFSESTGGKYVVGGRCDLGRKWRHEVFIEEMSFQVTADDMEGRIITQFGGLVLMWLEPN